MYVIVAQVSTQKKEGFIKIGSICEFRCGINEIWKNEKCLCKSEHAKIDGVCRKCPANSWPSKDQTECICKKDHYWNNKSRTCDYIICPPYSTVSYSDWKYSCKCDAGYSWYKGKCVFDCK